MITNKFYIDICNINLLELKKSNNNHDYQCEISNFDIINPKEKQNKIKFKLNEQIPLIRFTFQNKFIDTEELIMKFTRKNWFGIYYEFYTIKIPFRNLISNFFPKKFQKNYNNNIFKEYQHITINKQFNLIFEYKVKEDCINFTHSIDITDSRFNYLFREESFYPYLIIDIDHANENENRQTESKLKSTNNNYHNYFQYRYSLVKHSNSKSLFILTIPKINSQLLLNAQLVLPSPDYFWQNNLFNCKNYKNNEWISFFPAGFEYFGGTKPYLLSMTNQNTITMVNEIKQINERFRPRLRLFRSSIPNFEFTNGDDNDNKLITIIDQVHLHFNKLILEDLFKNQNENLIIDIQSYSNSKNKSVLYKTKALYYKEHMLPETLKKCNLIYGNYDREEKINILLID